jgi:WXG100 family type VII secretion target
MGKQIQVNYEEMAAIITRMRNEQGEIQQLQKSTKGKVDSLHNNQWIGKGSDKFFSEMEEKYLPALARLERALGNTADTAQKIVDTIRNADEGTKSFFNIG